MLMAGASALLKWTFIGASLVSAVELVQRSNLSPRRPVCLTLCDIAYLLCNMLTVSTICWAVATSVFPSRTEVLTDVSIASAVVSAAARISWAVSILVASRSGFNERFRSFLEVIKSLQVEIVFFKYSQTLSMQTIADEETFSPCGKLLGSAVLRTGPNAKGRVFCAFVRVLWHEALWIPLTGLAYFAVLIVRIPLLESLIDDVGSREAKALTVLFLSSCVAEVCLSGFLEYVALRFSTQLKLLMQAALFTKTTRMTARALSEAPAGYLVSLVAVDCDQLHTVAVFSSHTLSGLLCLPVLLWMLSRRVGTLPVVACVSWPLAVLALSALVSWMQTGLWKRIIRYRDERLNKMADTLSCVRLVKFYAWEEAVTQAVSRLRAREGRLLFLSNLLDGFVESLQSCSNSVKQWTSK
ncbi:ATP-binding cassette sub-family C member 10-like [Dermacentor silvarum]|uniref:ATP-binding cassette sub-family C member 10-like n=1 Tax=Dermacentor silvarum TaxID=543639 RepID=UPI002101354D|nr:ATP-binding cassette sub-family C member 10-like [Dermacentor silvarum]